MKTHHFNADSRIKDEASSGRDSNARESFTWRRMQPWQIWALGIAGVVLAVLGLIYVN